jgi:hypothetical protein
MPVNGEVAGLSTLEALEGVILLRAGEREAQRAVQARATGPVDPPSLIPGVSGPAAVSSTSSWSLGHGGRCSLERPYSALDSGHSGRFPEHTELGLVQRQVPNIWG